jgi:hypothetical protein
LVVVAVEVETLIIIHHRPMVQSLEALAEEVPKMLQTGVREQQDRETLEVEDKAT